LEASFCRSYLGLVLNSWPEVGYLAGLAVILSQVLYKDTEYIYMLTKDIRYKKTVHR
jgi:hypothetical protein